MAQGRPVGVIVGKHEHGLGGFDVHCAHYVDAGSFDTSKDDEATKTRRRSAAMRVSTVNRKGYKSFRCGDVVRSAEEEFLGMTALVFGVVIAIIRNQMRRLLVHCEMGAASAQKPGFFVAPGQAGAACLPRVSKN
eukprot:6177489-Pleurochrysis_carterae.AAC.1